MELENYRSEADWIVCRSGWRPNDAVLAFRSGLPANHEHADRNSFFYKIYGERLLNDHFGAAYHRENPLWTLRLTRAHNAVLIGGEGHQYHKGEEGVNESQAEARVVRYNPQGRRVWWSSDATQAYHLVNPAVSRVLRTVAFAKPGVIVLLDQIDLNGAAEEVEVRFFPDNRDGQAQLGVADGSFFIKRPGASLHGVFKSSGGLSAESSMLDLQEDLPREMRKSRDEIAALGDYPFVSLRSGPARSHQILTVMVARPSGEESEPEIVVQSTEQGWYFSADGVNGVLATEGAVPEVLWT